MWQEGVAAYLIVLSISAWRKRKRNTKYLSVFYQLPVWESNTELLEYKAGVPTTPTANSGMEG
jgi:hypothetical protein